MEENNMLDPENIQVSEPEEEINPNDSDDGRRFNDYSEGGFIASFCQLDGNEFFVEIDEEFIINRSNLYGIAKNYKNFEDLIDIMLSDEPIDENNFQVRENIEELKELYGQIHQRFIRSPKGLALMREKYLNGVFGICPRILCNKQTVLPIGLSDDLKYARVKIFCPRCEEIYNTRHKNSQMDGSYFGLSFPQQFFLQYPDLEPFTNNNLNSEYVPKLYGFKIYKKKGSKYFEKKNNL